MGKQFVISKTDKPSCWVCADDCIGSILGAKLNTETNQSIAQSVMLLIVNYARNRVGSSGFPKDKD